MPEGGGAAGAGAGFGGAMDGVQAGADVGSIGVSVEAVSALQQQTPNPSAAAPTTSDLQTFTTKMLESFFQFATSFASEKEAAMRQTDTQWVPLGCLQRWHQNFQHKMGLDPFFWRK
jgi:hypothetical protein